MRHGKTYNHLSRKSAHRKAMLANIATSLIIHKRIKTTTAKAKALRTFIEPIITLSKDDSTHSRRMAFKELGNKNAVSELFREVVEKVGDRPGGYTRIIKIDNRTGDNADMCIIELVDFNENLLAVKETAKTKITRRRRGKKKSETGVTAAEPSTTAEELMDESIESATVSETDDQSASADLSAKEETEDQADDSKTTDIKTIKEIPPEEKPSGRRKSRKAKT